MAAKILCSLVCVLGFVVLVTCQDISCYDCDPRNFGSDCGDPVGNNVRVSRCTPAVENGTSLCLSAYLNFTGSPNDTGIYRGCKTLRQDVSNFCDWFVEENSSQNLTVVSCEPCNATRCNTIGFREDGSSGAPSFTTAIFVILMNAMLLLIVNLHE
ncbi:hypothetical protein NQ318_022428 [Aromia moschata]|uniref:Uncharacterized protein n=1 Tax=Aromia moschata TaxID=1265417 RepID=A0AAV8Z7D1_9CUCU|nr:hypothetical protein NQ318_022428 [Aromia moschata]